jgi:C4-dicarboxylate-specific signal transduction histidine kinase/predicted metal-dependent HD superfamily phosphohydrolase
MNYADAEIFVLGQLRHKLPHSLYYHNISHTLDVVRATEVLCDLERLDTDSSLLIKTAALLHDCGFIEKYDKNESVGARLAGEWLPQFSYNKQQIDVICELIMATQSPRKPDGLFQKIICDADLDYLGRSDFFTVSQALRQEWSEHGRTFLLNDWYELEKDFLENHFYYTDSAYGIRNKKKLENLEEIKQLLAERGALNPKQIMIASDVQPLVDDRLKLVDLLSQTSLFRNAERQLLEQICMMVERITLRANEPLFKKGDPGESMYIIETGKLKVHDGNIELAELGPAAYFGEASLIDNSPRTASVSAKTAASILRLGIRDFFSLLGSNPSMNRLLMKELINRLRNQNDAVVAEFRSREAKLQELVELRTKQIVEEKKNVEKKSLELELALKELQEAQRLLIHQEKMASLGQLTTGIAHELLNPLNFVNNFSAVSIDLMEELKELSTDEEAKELCTDILDNLQRISQHGHRAGEIVRSMAEHSSAFGKERHEVDVHALINDAVGVSVKTWSNTFPEENVSIEMHFDADHHKTSAVYSDLFRVMINLLRNAASAIQDRLVTNDKREGNISLSTRNEGNDIIIGIRDNGIGIPEVNLEKIFLPFFTTRPTGKGVGLGLSISHQIVTAYGGNLRHVPSEDGAVFEIVIPVAE